MKYDENIPFYFTKREALTKVGKSVRAKANTQSNSSGSYPIPNGTPGTVIVARVFKNTRQHRRWAVEVRWDIELTPFYPGQELEDGDRKTIFPRRKYETEITEVHDEE